MDDNCDIYGKDKPITGSEGTSSKTTTDTERTKAAEAEAMVDMIMKRMNQVFRPPQRLQRCEACGGDHPTNQCLPKQNYQAHKPPRTDKWCEFERIWTNHETVDCYHRIKHMREEGINQQPASAPQALHYAPRVGNPNYAAQGVERAQPVLGSQPPLPGAAMVRYIQPEDVNNEGAVVPVNYYGEENGDNASNYASPSSGPYETPTVILEGS